MNIIQKTARKIIKKSFDLAISTIEYFSDMEKYDEKISELRNFELGTLGKKIADCLDKNNLTLVPKYESHDLKHVLLDYKMTAEDEIRMQAFMVGNGNYSIPSFTILLFGSLLLPDLWSTLYCDYKKGRKSISISHWSIEEYAKNNLDELKEILLKPVSQKKEKFSLKHFIKLGAFTSIISGILGMAFCLPFLFSENIADLVGAGFPFIGGAILSVGGLLVLSNQNIKQQLSTSIN